MLKVALDASTLARLDAIRDALDAAGCEPRGRAHDFRSRCPVHRGRSRDTLHVWLSDGDVIAVHCHNGCTGGKRHGRPSDPRPVMDALGLPMSLLFAPANGDRRARGISLGEAGW